MLPYTKIPGVPDRHSVVPGMAHFAGSGPLWKYCSDCALWGYYRQRQRWSEKLKQDVTKATKHPGCAKYKELMGTDGPAILGGNRSCKYFEPK